MPTKENKTSWLRKLGWRLSPPKKYAQLIKRRYPVELIKGLVYYEDINGEFKLSESSNAFIDNFKSSDFRKAVMLSEVLAELNNTNAAKSAAILSFLRYFQNNPDFKWNPKVVILNKPDKSSKRNRQILKLSYVKAFTFYFEWDCSNEVDRELRQTIVSESERGYADAWDSVTDAEVIGMSMMKARRQFELFLRIGII